MNADPFIGKRTKNRFQVLNCRVQLKSKGILGLFGKEIHQLSLINLSSAGLQAISPTMLKPNIEYDIAILAPAFPYPLSAKGIMIWNQPHTSRDNSRYYRVGLEFTYFKEESMKKIKELENSPELRKLA